MSEFFLSNSKATSTCDLPLDKESSSKNIQEENIHNNSEISEEKEESDDDSYEDNRIVKFEGIGSWGTFGINDVPWTDNHRPFANLIKFEDLKLTDEEKSGVLTQRIVASCSSYLDKCPVTRRYALCKCVMTQQGLNDISVLYQNTFLQYVNLSWNDIEDLSALSNLPCLMYLDVSHNKVKELLNFKPPYNLTFVNYSHNFITKIKDLSHFWSIKKLNLSHNLIQVIEGISSLKYLETLDLSHNKIRRIENLSYLNIQNLNLQNNEIHSFECDTFIGLHTMPYLSYVRLAHNKLSSLKLFERACFVQSIDMVHNNIRNLSDLKCLQTLNFLIAVNFNNNPIKQCVNYEFFCLNTMKGLQLLDETPTNISSKVLANSILQPNIKEKAAKQHGDILSLSHLAKVPNLGLYIIPADQPPRPLVIVVGLVGGKQDKLIKDVSNHNPRSVTRLIKHTTRAKFKHETDDDYYFVSHEEFNKLLEGGEFLIVYETLNNNYGLTQEEFATKSATGKVMILEADIYATLVLRIRGFEPVIVLAMPKSEDIHRFWLDEIYGTRNKRKNRYSEAPVEDDDSDHNQLKENTVLMPSDFRKDKLLKSEEKVTCVTFNKSNADFLRDILKSREVFLEFHLSNPGIFYETIYTDEPETAIYKLKNVIHFVNNNVSNRETFGKIYLDSAFQTIIGQKMKIFDEEIERSMKKNLLCPNF